MKKTINRYINEPNLVHNLFEPTIIIYCNQILLNNIRVVIVYIVLHEKIMFIIVIMYTVLHENIMFIIVIAFSPPPPPPPPRFKLVLLVGVGVVVVVVVVVCVCV